MNDKRPMLDSLHKDLLEDINENCIESCLREYVLTASKVVAILEN